MSVANGAGFDILNVYTHAQDQDAIEIDAQLQAAPKQLAALGSSTRVEAPAEAHTVRI